MSFATAEQSTESGRPVRLYVFQLGSAYWRYTSADTDQVVNTGSGDKLYRKITISDDGVQQTGNDVSDTLTITASAEVAPAQMFSGRAPSGSMSLTILDKHADIDNEAAVCYVGEVIQVSINEIGQAKISCEAIGSALNREGLRIGWQLSCPYVLYDPRTCKASAAPFLTTIRVVDVDLISITVEATWPTTSGLTFDGGFIQFTHPTKGVQRLTIESRTGNVLTMFDLLDDVYPGMTATAYPGCNHGPEMCTVFGNYDNYGGVPNLPGKSPFDGNQVF